MLLRLLLFCYNAALFYFYIVPSELVERAPMGWLLIDVGKPLEGGIVHYFAMLALFVIWFFNIKDSRKSLLVAILTGILLESVQLALPWRSFSLMDELWNLAGCLTGYVALSPVKRIILSRIS